MRRVNGSLIWVIQALCWRLHCDLSLTSLELKRLAKTTYAIDASVLQQGIAAMDSEHGIVQSIANSSQYSQKYTSINRQTVQLSEAGDASFLLAVMILACHLFIASLTTARIT